MTAPVLLAALLVGLGPAPACAAPPVQVEVSGLVAPVQVTSDFSLSELEQAARNSPNPPNHPVMGFYRATRDYVLEVGSVAAAAPGCPEPLRVRVTLRLRSRRIEIARELASEPCRLSAALAHYGKLAHRDVLVVSDDVVRLRRALQQAPMQVQAAGGTRVVPDRRSAMIEAEAIIDQTLRSAPSDQAATDALNAPSEFTALGAACTRSL